MNESSGKITQKLSAKKSLGQHFLTSKHVLGQIIEAAALQPGEKVLEIGPGMGVLTEALLNSPAQPCVIAVEKDDRAIEFLETKFAEHIKSSRLELIHGDVLDPELSLPFANNKYALIANIPYYITGSILEKFLEHEPRPNRMVLLVQKEVADRIIARDNKESILSISVKAFGTPKMIAKVPPGAFNPPPTVDSAILEVSAVSDKRFLDAHVQPADFFRFIRAGFAHKRKLLKRNLEAVVDPARLDQVWNEFKLDEKVRAEDLKLDDWFNIAQKMA